MTRTQKVLRRLTPEWQDVTVVCRAKTVKEFNQRHSVLHGLTEKGSVEHRTVGKGSLLQGQYRLKTQPKNPCPWPPRKNVARCPVEQAARLSHSFHGLSPRRLTGLKITWPKALVLIGHVVRLDYLSDKEDGKPRIYTHDFERPVQVFASGSAKGGQKNMLLLHGQFTITNEGIVG